MSKPDQESKVSLEDLLRLKRAERPSVEFWKNFESELRQKQLTALVRKRRWWHDVPMLLNRRIYLPTGAAAIVALTVVTVRYEAPTPIVPEDNTTLESPAENSATVMLDATEVSISRAGLIHSGSHAEPQALALNPVSSVPVVEAAGFTPSAMSISGDGAVPVGRDLAASLARLEPLETDFGDSGLGSGLGATARAQPAMVDQSEVASMTTVSASKYRLIARYVDRSLSPAPAAPAVVRERLARRLGDDLNDDISRIGVVGSRVSLKF